MSAQGSRVEPPTLQLSADEISTTGATPGGSVVWLGVGRSRQTYFEVKTRVRELTVADAAGTARLARPGGVPWASVWVVADLASGQLTVAVPAEFPREERAFPMSGLEHGLSGEGDTLSLPNRGVELLWIRPATGAWVVTAIDEGAADSDGDGNAAVRVSTQAFSPLGSAPPPPLTFASGDAVMAIDREELTFSWIRLTPESLVSSSGTGSSLAGGGK